jgi:uncharacterized membrane protein
VILLFAYNWNGIPKFGKLALIFAAIVGAHIAGLIFHRTAGWQRKLGEAFTLLGTMFFGAGIWLVAQIYHIDAHYPDGFLVWALGALLVAWILESIPHGLLATVLLAIWGSTEVFDFQHPNFWALAIVAIAVVPLAWRKRSALLLGFVLAAVELLLIANVIDYGGRAHGFASALALAIFLIAAARITTALRSEFSNGATVMAFFGFGGFFFCCYLLGFHGLADDLLDRAPSHGSNASIALAWSWILFALAAGAWIWIAGRSLVRKRLTIHLEEWLMPIALAYAYGLGAAGYGIHVYAEFIAGSFNLILLGIAVMWMWRGCNESELEPTLIGSLLLAAVMFARYFDLFDSLAARGLAFILLGGIFLAEALYYRKNRRERPSKAGGAT